MEILKYPNPALLTPCKEVTVFGKEISILMELMVKTMKSKLGMGLAANQVGLPYRMFVMEDWEKKEIHFIVNPKIVWRSVAPANQKEGCLSAPGEILILKERSDAVLLEYKSPEGEPLKRMFTGILAVCVQHEIDHLDGKSHLQSSSIPKAKRKELKKKWGV